MPASGAFTWNPDLYLRYARQRNQPSRDLITRLDDLHVERGLDVGCGPGNSTALLMERWPEARFTGLDSSAEMIAQASRAYPAATWLHRDAGGDLSDLGAFDLIFSNAALQWIPNHQAVIPHLYSLIRPGGALAVQVPNNPDAIHQAIADTVALPRWRAFFPNGHTRLYQLVGHFYPILAALGGEVTLWETSYYHSMDSFEEVMSWYRGSQLRQYLARLSDADGLAFLEEIRRRAAPGYPLQPDGRVLFPFKRLLFIVRKGEE